MSRLEILNSGALRLDGRRPHELRSLALHIAPGAGEASASGGGGSSSSKNTPRTSLIVGKDGTTQEADGSARVEQGLSTVYAAVYGPREARSRSATLHDRAVIDVDVSLEPWSGRERRKRARGDRRVAEMSAAIKATFEPVVQTHLYPRSTIDVFVAIENQDGGVLPCAINAVTLALLDAGISMSDYVVSLSVGLHLQSSKTLLDLSSQEENALPHLIAATLPRSGKITLAQLETRIHASAVEEMLAVIGRACAVLHLEMDTAMRQRTQQLADAMSGKSAAQQRHDASTPREDEVMQG